MTGMMLGVGTDIVKIARVRDVLAKNGDKLLKRVFTDSEMRACVRRYGELISDKTTGYWAKRYAAKEALSKAFGTGIGAMISFQDVEVLSDEHGAPYFNLLSDYLREHCSHAKLSLADEDEYAIAFVVISKEA